LDVAEFASAVELRQGTRDPFGPAPPSRVALATEEFLIRSSGKLNAQVGQASFDHSFFLRSCVRHKGVCELHNQARATDLMRVFVAATGTKVNRARSG
jgi:hypothetical protein